MSDKPIIITLTISPVAGGKRKVVVTGAPKGEMPVVRAGTFAQVHQLLDQVWVDLSKRKPQTVTVKKEETKKPTAQQPKTPAVATPTYTPDEEGGADMPVEGEGGLPVIEGDVIEGDTSSAEENNE